MKMPSLIIYFIVVINLNNVMSESNNLSIACWNLRGYLSSIPYLRYLLKGNSVVATSEHWLHKNRLNVLDDICDTHSYFARSSRFSSSETFGSTRGQGGVSIFWRSDIAGVSVISSITHDRICGIKLHLSSNVIISILSAVGGEDSFPNCLDELSAAIDSSCEDSLVIIVGNFNADVGNSGGPSGIKAPTKRGLLLLDFIKRHDLSVANMLDLATGPVHTHEGPNSYSTLDYILIPIVIMRHISKCHVEDNHPLNTSDHSPVSVECIINGLTHTRCVDHVSDRIRWDRLTPLDIGERYSDMISSHLTVLNMKLANSNVTSELIDAGFNQLTRLIHSAASTLPRSEFVKHIKHLLERQFK